MHIIQMLRLANVPRWEAKKRSVRRIFRNWKLIISFSSAANGDEKCETPNENVCNAALAGRSLEQRGEQNREQNPTECTTLLRFTMLFACNEHKTSHVSSNQNSSLNHSPVAVFFSSTHKTSVFTTIQCLLTLPLGLILFIQFHFVIAKHTSLDEKHTYSIHLYMRNEFR